MTRRPAPRPAAAGLRKALARAAPRTPLAAVQSEWEAAVGARLAAVAQPLGEQAGEVVVGCVDSVWAQELDLMGPQLLQRLQERLGEQAPKSLRFCVKEMGD